MKVIKHYFYELSSFFLSHSNQNELALGRIHFIGVGLYHRARCYKPDYKRSWVLRISCTGTTFSCLVYELQILLMMGGSSTEELSGVFSRAPDL
jgi:hypothetical protein